MGFVVYRTGDLNTNERLIAFYKKELLCSGVIEKAKKQAHYGTKWYRRVVSFRFPSKRRYIRMRALVSDSYRKFKKKYETLALLGKVM